MAMIDQIMKQDATYLVRIQMSLVSLGIRSAFLIITKNASQIISVFVKNIPDIDKNIGYLLIRKALMVYNKSLVSKEDIQEIMTRSSTIRIGKLLGYLEPGKDTTAKNGYIWVNQLYVLKNKKRYGCIYSQVAKINHSIELNMQQKEWTRILRKYIPDFEGFRYVFYNRS